MATSRPFLALPLFALAALASCGSGAASRDDASHIATRYPEQVLQWVDETESTDKRTRNRAHVSLAREFDRTAEPVLRRLAEYAESRRLEDLKDIYQGVREDVVRNALDEANPDHSHFAREVDDALENIAKQLNEALEPKYLSVDGMIDAILLSHQLALDRAAVRRTIESRLDLMTYLVVPDVLSSIARLGEPFSPGQIDDFLTRMRIVSESVVDAEKPPLDPRSYRLAKIAVSRLERSREQMVEWGNRAAEWDPTQKAEIEKAVAAGTAGIDARKAYLEKTVIPPLENSWSRWGEPVGEAYFEFLLRTRHLLAMTPAELLSIGRRQLESIRGEMEEVAKKIEPDKDLRTVLEDMRNEHPTREDLPLAAGREMDKALEFLLRRDIVTVPEEAQSAKVVLTHGDLAATYPFGGYGGFELGGKTKVFTRELVGRYLVSPPSLGASEKDFTERLRGNHIYWTRIVAIHETFPGHHLQAVVARRNANGLRRAFSSDLLIEGWGLYSEEIMYRHGYFPDERTRLAQLQMRLWRAARVVIDVALHTRQMTPDEAVGLLVHEVGLTPETATSEVRRYLGNPTQPMSYLVGYLEIMRLRKDVEAATPDFEERKFHDQLLRYGPIPPSLIRLGFLGRHENPYPTADEILPRTGGAGAPRPAISTP